jgi:hypothetical protein
MCEAVSFSFRHLTQMALLSKCVSIRGANCCMQSHIPPLWHTLLNTMLDCMTSEVTQYKVSRKMYANAQDKHHFVVVTDSCSFPCVHCWVKWLQKCSDCIWSSFYCFFFVHLENHQNGKPYSQVNTNIMRIISIKTEYFLTLWVLTLPEAYLRELFWVFQSFHTNKYSYI